MSDDSPPVWHRRSRDLTPEQVLWCLDRVRQHADADAALALLNAFVRNPTDPALAAHVAGCLAQWLPKAEGSRARQSFGIDGKPENQQAFRRAMALALLRDHGPKAACEALSLGERGLYAIRDRATDADYALADLLHPPA